MSEPFKKQNKALQRGKNTGDEKMEDWPLLLAADR